MKFINLTNVTLSIATTDGKKNTGVRKIEPEKRQAFVASTQGEHEIADEVRIIDVHMGEVEGVPPPKEGVYYIVPSVVAMVLKRPDVLCPGIPIRDSEGRIIGVSSLQRMI